MSEKKKKSIPAEFTILIIFLVIFISSFLFIRDFKSLNNITNLLRSTAINGIIAIGMTFVIIGAGIDLTVGAVAGLSGVVASMMMVKTGGIWFPILLGIVCGTMVGALNGIVIFDGKVPPFIATLGMSTAVRGSIYLMTDARLITNLPAKFTGFAQIRIFNVPAMVLVWIAVVLNVHYLGEIFLR